MCATIPVWQGRWMVVGRRPTVVCDTGHNAGGWQYLAPRLASLPGVKHMVLGFVSDKDVSHILEMMPRGNVRYYFTRASIDRAMDSVRLLEIARGVGLDGTSYPTVKDAVAAAMAQAKGGRHRVCRRLDLRGGRLSCRLPRLIVRRQSPGRVLYVILRACLIINVTVRSVGEHISARSSVVMESHNSLITSENLSDD